MRAKSSRTNTGRTDRSRPLAIEALEDRRLLAVSLNLGGAQTLAANTPVSVEPEQAGLPTIPRAELTLDVDPTNPLNLAGFSHNLTNRSVIDVFYSQDGGANWSTVTIDANLLNPNMDPFGQANRRFDPSIAYDANGVLYIAYGHELGDVSRLIVARSFDKGATFVDFTEVDSETDANFTLDKWHLATGPDGRVGQLDNEVVYVAYLMAEKDLVTPDIEVRVAGAITGLPTFDFQGATATDDYETVNNEHIQGDFVVFPDPAVGPNGELYVAWVDLDDPPADPMNPTDDIGATDQGGHLADEQVDAGERLLIDVDVDGLFGADHDFGTDQEIKSLHKGFLKSRVPAAPSRGIHTGLVIDTDRSGGVNDGRVYATWVDTFTSGALENTDVYLAYSDDRGQTWTDPGIFAGNVEDSPGTEFLPWVDVDQTTGSVNVIYYTTEGDPNHEKVHVRLATSLDGGESFFATDISTVASDESGGLTSDYLEYIGLAVHDGTAHGLWTSTNPLGRSLEPLNVSVVLASDIGENILFVTGDEGTVADVIEISLVDRTNPNPNVVLEDFVEVRIKEAAQDDSHFVTQFAGLASTIDKIVVYGLVGIDSVEVSDDIQNDPNIELIIYDPATLKVSDVSIKGSNLNDGTPGGIQGEYRIPSGNGKQIQTVPIGGANQLKVRFSDDIDQSTLDGAIEILEVSTSTDRNVTADFTRNLLESSGSLAVWDYTAGGPIPKGQYELKLYDTISTVGPNSVQLDGDWVNPTNFDSTDTVNFGTVGSSSFPSGDGFEGGDFTFYFTILPGDANQDNAVGAADSAEMFANFDPLGTTWKYQDGDFSGDGAIGAADSALLFSNFDQLGAFKTWPTSSPLQPAKIETKFVGDDRLQFGLQFGANAEIALRLIERAVDAWEEVITDFAYEDASRNNTFELRLRGAVTGPPGLASLIVPDGDGRPISATITFDNDAAGFGWFFDTTPKDDAEFPAINTPYWASFVDETHAGTDGPLDFYSVALHEIGHAIGLDLDLIQGRAAIQTQTLTYESMVGFDQRSHAQGEELDRFIGPNVNVTFTNAGEGHLYEGPADPSNPNLPLHPFELMNDGTNTVLPHSDAISRRLISDLTVQILEDAYGYTVRLPSTINTMHATLDEATGTLLVQGLPDVNGEDINIELENGNVKVTVMDGGVLSGRELFPAESVKKIVVYDPGNDTLDVHSNVTAQYDVQFAHYIVSSNEDSGDFGAADDGIIDVDTTTPGRQVPLRAAILEANGANNSRSRIYVPRGVYQIPELQVTDEVTVIGSGPGATIINGDSSRHFKVEPSGKLEVRRLTLAGATGAFVGGSIFVDPGNVHTQTNDDALLILDSAIVNNSAVASGGAVYVDGDSIASITNSVITGNSSTFGAGGGVFASGNSNGSAIVTIVDSIVANNSSPATGTDTNIATGGTGNQGQINQVGVTHIAGGSDNVLVVTSVEDSFDDTDDIYSFSLREAVHLFNETNPAPTGIWVPAWNYILTRDRRTYGIDSTGNPFATDSTAAYGDLDVTKSLTISAAGDHLVSIAWKVGTVDKVFDMLGDSNGDGIVDDPSNTSTGSDGWIWSVEAGSMPAFHEEAQDAWERFQADFDDDGDVDLDDFAILASHAGNALVFNNMDFPG